MSFIVIDLSHWLDELFLKVLTEADMVLMLTGLTVPDLRNLKKLWPYTMEWHQDKRKIKIVVNRYDNSSGLQLRDLENILQHPAFATLPSDYQALMQCLNQGSPLMGAAPRSKLWREHQRTGVSDFSRKSAMMSTRLTAPPHPERNSGYFKRIR